LLKILGVWYQFIQNPQDFIWLLFLVVVMALDELVSVLALCSIGSANLVAAVRQLQVLRNLLIGEKQAFQLSQRLGECEKRLSKRD